MHILKLILKLKKNIFDSCWKRLECMSFWNIYRILHVTVVLITKCKIHSNCALKKTILKESFTAFCWNELIGCRLVKMSF